MSAENPPRPNDTPEGAIDAESEDVVEGSYEGEANYPVPAIHSDTQESPEHPVSLSSEPEVATTRVYSHDPEIAAQYHVPAEEYLAMEQEEAIAAQEQAIAEKQRLDALARLRDHAEAMHAHVQESVGVKSIESLSEAQKESGEGTENVESAKSEEGIEQTNKIEHKEKDTSKKKEKKETGGSNVLKRAGAVGGTLVGAGAAYLVGAGVVVGVGELVGLGPLAATVAPYAGIGAAVGGFLLTAARFGFMDYVGWSLVKELVGNNFAGAKSILGDMVGWLGIPVGTGGGGAKKPAKAAASHGGGHDSHGGGHDDHGGGGDHGGGHH